jgi:DNA topoisomerase-1
LPKVGKIVVIEKQCAEHGLYPIKIINKGKRPWDIRCPHCNFIEWQKKVESEKNGLGKKD